MGKRKPTSRQPATTTSRKPRSKYDPSMCDRVIELGRKGKSKTQMAARLEIARSTFDRYLEEHEEFREAYELADTHSQALWEQIGMGGLAKGHLFNDRAWQFQVRNRWPASYRDKELEFAGGATISIRLTPADAAL